jgi:predicted phage-related endonuclease
VKSDSVIKDRDKYIGGSDIPILMGISPFKTRWQLLKEKAEPRGDGYATEYTSPQIEYGNEMEEKIRACVIRNEEVQGIDMLQTRIFGNKIYVDVEILLDGNYTLKKAHEIAEAVHDDIEEHFPKVKHIMVHVNPAEEAEKSVDSEDV